MKRFKFKTKKGKILYAVLFLIMFLSFYLGIFANPNFNIHDFFAGLATELFGLVIALTVVEAYIKEKTKEKE